MSNQAYSGGVRRYAPNKSESDLLTITKNVPATGSAPAWGYAPKTATRAGNGLYFGRLNGVPCTTVGNVVQYDVNQNPASKPYYTIAANSTIRDGATTIYSKTDNVLSISCCLPGCPIGSGNIPMTLSIRVYNADGTIDFECASLERDIPAQIATPTADTQCSISGPSAVVRVAAGQSVSAMVYINESPSIPFRIQDRLLPLGGGAYAMQFEACMAIQKL